MAKRNRRKKTEGFVIALPWAALLAAGAVLMLFYVWLDAHGQALGKRIKAAEQQRTELQKRYDFELWKWETLKSPANIERALSQHQIEMVWPGEDHLVRLREPSLEIEELAGKSRQIAQLAQFSRLVVND